MVGSLLKSALGAGAVLAGAFVVSKLQDRQQLQRRLDNLERMVETLSDEKPA